MDAYTVSTFDRDFRWSFGYLNCVKVENLFSIFDNYAIKSTVSINNVETVDENVRNSKILKGVCIRETYNVIPRSKFNDILPAVFESKYQLPEKNWDMIVYEEGGFFSKHSDSKKSANHMGTILLLPPKHLNDYEGGELIIYDGNNQYSILPDKDKWKCVMFPVNVYHELKPVTKGRRIVFKNEFLISDDILEYFTDKYEDFKIEEKTTIIPETLIEEIENKLDVLDDKTDEIEDKIKSLKQELEEIESEKILLNKQKGVYENQDYKYLLEKIKEKLFDNPVMVVLERRYQNDDPSMLIGDDYRLFCLIKKKYPRFLVKLINEDIEHNVGDNGDYDIDDEDDDKKYCQYDKYHNFPERLGKDYLEVEVLFQNDKNDIYPGRLANRKLEFNDNTYDTIYELNITAILIKRI